MKSTLTVLVPLFLFKICFPHTTLASHVPAGSPCLPVTILSEPSQPHPPQACAATDNQDPTAAKCPTPTPTPNPSPELIWGICLSFGRPRMKPCTHRILGVEEFSDLCLVSLWWLIQILDLGPEAYIILGTFFKKKDTKIAYKFPKYI